MGVKRSNKQLFRMIQVMVIIGTLVTANVLFTMVTKTHIWSGHTVLDDRIQKSIVTTNVAAKRGTIYDRNNQIIAQEVKAYTIVAYLDESYADADGNPDYVKNARTTAKKLKTVLKDIDANTVQSIIENAQEAGKTQTELGMGTKRLDKETKKKIEKLDLPGIHFVDTTNRDYPDTPFASSLVGFAAFDEDKQEIDGKMGLEQTLNKQLSGEDGMVQYQKTVTGDVLPGTTKILKQSTNGNDVVLTIDANLQMTVENAMKQTMEQNNAEKAWCIVMEPKTGKILAWASYPTFDQNEHDKIESYIDNISTSQYEPGSVMKPFTFATAIDTGVYPDEDTTFRAGSFNYGYDPETKKIIRQASGTNTGYPVIYDALQEDFGTINFDTALAYSSNVGICELLSNYINYKQYKRYVENFGFYQYTDIPYVDEAQGVNNIDVEFPINYLTSGFGQGSSITVLQLCQAYTAIFNDGKMMRPYVVDSIIDTDTNEVLKKYEPKEVGTPISEETADHVSELMSHVLDAGASGEKFQMDGVDMIAKTGTGQIYNEETGTYDEERYTSSIMAAAPQDSPQVMVYWGMVSTNYLEYSAEPFQDIMHAALIAQGVSGSNENGNDQNYEKWESYEMPSLVNHSMTYAEQQLDGKKVKVVKIGEGSNVIDQYPLRGTVVNSNDRVFLVTNDTSIKMPDMTGWTRKDLTAFWQLTGISIQTDGYGKVVSQNQNVGNTITKDTVIEVKLE